MRIIRIITVFLIVVLTFAGCGRGQDIHLEYADRGFECEMSWEWESVRYRAVLSMGDMSDTAMDRNIYLTFCEPASLCGVKIERAEGGERISLGETTFEGADGSGILEITELFQTDGKIVSSSLVTLGTEQTNLVRLRREDGGEISVYLSGKDGAPMRICGDVGGRETQLDILRFDMKKPRE